MKESGGQRGGETCLTARCVWKAGRAAACVTAVHGSAVEEGRTACLGLHSTSGITTPSCLVAANREMEPVSPSPCSPRQRLGVAAHVPVAGTGKRVCPAGLGVLEHQGQQMDGAAAHSRACPPPGCVRPCARPVVPFGAICSHPLPSPAAQPVGNAAKPRPRSAHEREEVVCDDQHRRPGRCPGTPLL